MRRILNFLIQTNIFISLAAVALTVETQVQLGMKPQLHPYLFLIFFATIFDYNLHRLITVTIKKAALKDAKHQWVNSNLKGFYLLVTLSVVGFLIAVLFARKQVLFALAPIAIITVFYSFPIFKSARSIFRLREIPLLKIFLIAFVWSASTIFLPIIHLRHPIHWPDVLMMVTERFLFVLAITIPFDIRDMKVDVVSGIRTIPIMLGEKRSIILANFLLASFLILCSWHYCYRGDYFLIPAYIISGLSTIIFINNKKIMASPAYHYGVLDGTMLIQGILVCLASWIRM
jgi:4-hydroxybenzoate polyprenyltransferase